MRNGYEGAHLGDEAGGVDAGHGRLDDPAREESQKWGHCEHDDEKKHGTSTCIYGEKGSGVRTEC